MGSPVHPPPTSPLEENFGLRRVVSRLRASSGFRAGAILGIATLVLNGSAYLYNVACIRYLGPSVYGDMAAMLALLAIVSLPLGSVQSLLAREVAQLLNRSDVSRLLRRSAFRSGVLGVALLALGLAFIAPIEDVLNVGSRSTVIAGLSTLPLALAAAVLYGFLQGELRFWSLSKVYAVGGMARPVLVVPALLLGLGAAGALAVNTVAGLLAVALAAYALRDLWAPTAPGDVPTLDHGQMAVMLMGSLAFASLTNVDILLASYYLPGDVAGVYAAAALVGKAVLFLPTAVVTVLLPKAASRVAVGLTADKILLASVAATLFLGLTTTFLLALVPESLLVWAFGPDFRTATGLLPWFGLAMTSASLVNVYLSVYFAERKTVFPLLVVGAAVAQIVGVSIWHSRPLSIVIVTFVCATSLLVLHELFFSHSLVRALRGLRA